METSQVRRLVLDVLEDIGLAIGQMVSLHTVPEEAIWGLARAMDRVRESALARLGDDESVAGETEASSSVPHPAVEEFLRRLRGS